MAIEERDTYKSYLEKMSGQGVSSNEINNYSVLQEQLKAVEEENNILKQQLASSSANIDSSTKFVRDQNETLLQEIRRLKAELSSLSGK
jgi:hypothetical protein